jgi:hypothetical protein
MIIRYTAAAALFATTLGVGAAQANTAVALRSHQSATAQTAGTTTHQAGRRIAKRLVRQRPGKFRIGNLSLRNFTRTPAAPVALVEGLVPAPVVEVSALKGSEQLKREDDARQAELRRLQQLEAQRRASQFTRVD